MQPGQDFTDAVDAALRRSDAALAVIGPQWLTAAGIDGEPRLADETDYVRSELVAALASTRPVIPVLVGGAAMPTAARLPDDLKPLALPQAVTLRDESWHRDVDDLIHALGGDRLRARPRRWVIAAVVLGGLVAAGAIALMLLNHDGGEQSSTTTARPSNTAGPSTTLNRDTVLPVCENPASSTSGWTSLGVRGTTAVGSAGNPSASVDVIDGYYRKGQAGRWDVVLTAEFTNMTDASQTHYWWFYRLAVDGRPFVPDCFNVTAGQNPAGPGETSAALVGFDINVGPTNGGALLVDTAGDLGRIELIPT